MKDEQPIPEGWTWATVDEVATDLRYGTSAKTSITDSGVPVLRMGNISVTGELRVDALKYLPREHPDLDATFLQEGDLLFNRTNSFELVGKSAVYLGSPSPCSFASYLIRVRLGTRCLPKYLAFVLNSHIGRGWIKSVVSQQVGQANVNGSKLRAFRFPLAPLQDQYSIVAELEMHSSRIENALTALLRAKKNLTRYRRTILASIFDERHWPRISLDSVIRTIEAGNNFRCDERPPELHEFGVAKVSAVSWGEYNEEESKTCTEGRRFQERHLVRSGDFLMSRANTLELVGAAVIVGAIQRRIMLSDKVLRLTLGGVDPRWVLYALRSDMGRQQIERLSTGNQLSMRNISQASIRKIEIPIPTPDIQATLIQTIESAFTRADDLETNIEKSVRRASRLRQSILKCAFEGTLVPGRSESPTSIGWDSGDRHRRGQNQRDPFGIALQTARQLEK